jgi:hypothetical protein
MSRLSGTLGTLVNDAMASTKSPYWRYGRGCNGLERPIVSRNERFMRSQSVTTCVHAGYSILVGWILSDLSTRASLHMTCLAILQPMGSHVVTPHDRSPPPSPDGGSFSIYVGWFSFGFRILLFWVCFAFFLFLFFPVFHGLVLRDLVFWVFSCSPFFRFFTWLVTSTERWGLTSLVTPAKRKPTELGRVEFRPLYTLVIVVVVVITQAAAPSMVGESAGSPPPRLLQFYRSACYTSSTLGLGKV